MAVRRSRPFRAVLGIVAMVVGTVAVPGLVRPAEAGPSTADGLIAFSFGVQLPPADEDLFFPSDIYTVRPDGTGLRQLTHVPDGATAALPSWSPAGGAIAYQSDAAEVTTRSGRWEPTERATTGCSAIPDASTCRRAGRPTDAGSCSAGATCRSGSSPGARSRSSTRTGRGSARSSTATTSTCGRSSRRTAGRSRS